MDCNTGAQLGRQFTKDAMMMHGGMPMDAGMMDQSDLMMNMPPQMMGQGMQQQQQPDWAQVFQQQQQQMAMREMDQVFQAQRMQQHQQGPTMVGPAAAVANPMALQHQHHQHQHHQQQMMMGGAAMMASGVGFGMMMPRSQYQPGMNLQLQQQQQPKLQQVGDATATTAQDMDWSNRLAQQEWAQSYDDVQDFTVDGQQETSVADRTKESEFYQFMDRVKNKEILIDEDRGEVVTGPGPEAEVTAAAAGFASPSAGFNVPGATTAGTGFMDGQQQSQSQQHREDWPEDEPYGQDADIANDMEMDDWAKEYMDSQARLNDAMNNTDYPFEPNNHYLRNENAYAEGLELLTLSNLAEAALAFEAACQQSKDHFEAWRVLGTTQAENEKDALAVIALNNARRLNARDVGVHSALSVSHTNEHNTQAALECLLAYLANHPEYEAVAGLTLEADPDVDLDAEQDGFFFADPVLFREVKTRYRAAMELNPSDVQLHTNLGVAYSISHDFDAAAECFRRGVALRPGDPILWNKLGATLANGSHGEEALEAYNRALDINPGYVRAMYNMGVAYNNLGRYKLAARQIVRAIAVQQGDTNPSGEGSFIATRGMWELLRMTLNLIDRQDLVDMTFNQDLGPLVREFGLEGMV